MAVEMNRDIGRTPVSDPDSESSAPASAAAHLLSDIWQVLPSLKVSLSVSVKQA